MQTKKLKVLAVDDDFINLKLIHSILKRNPHVHSIREAFNGLEALDALQKDSDVDIIFLDLKMPVMNGIEFLINAQSVPKLKKIPVVVLTTDETYKYEALNNGAYDFIVKPIHESDLTQKIQEIVQKSSS